MKKVYFVRHGESDFNAGGVIKDESEVELTELGHTQAEFVGKRVSKLEPEIIISSTLLRACQTAQYIADATGKEIETSDVFVERRYPSGNVGLTNKHPEVKVIERLMITHFGEGIKHSDEELFQELKERAIKAFELLEIRQEQTIVVVTHGIFLRVLLSVAIFGKEVTVEQMGKIINAFKTKNTGITFLEYNPDELDSLGAWSVRAWNDHAHLG
jgi:broad specificity phosphatase PhoE